MTRQFTGRHIAAILVSFFAVVTIINIVNLLFATRTFGGLVVENSYVASQKFNGWLEQARQEEALGWHLAVRRLPGGRVAVTVAAADRTLPGASLTGTARHPLGRLPERTLAFRFMGDGRYESVEALPPGRWVLRLTVEAEGRAARKLVDLP